MRIGKVIGQLTLSRSHQAVQGAQWKVAVPLTEENLRSVDVPLGEELIVYDVLSAAEGQMIAFSEGAEASMPFYPNPKPLDAYCAAILDNIELA